MWRGSRGGPRAPAGPPSRDLDQPGWAERDAPQVTGAAHLRDEEALAIAGGPRAHAGAVGPLATLGQALGVGRARRRAAREERRRLAVHGGLPAVGREGLHVEAPADP